MEGVPMPKIFGFVKTQFFNHTLKINWN